MTGKTRTPNLALRRGFLRCALLLLLPRVASAEDVKLSDGTVFRNVRVLEVHPDALVLSHDRGVAMADLAKLPKSLRVRYGYDPREATAYRERAAIARRAKAVEDRRLVAAHEQRKMDLARLQMETSKVASAPGTALDDAHFSYRASVADQSYASAVARVGAEIARHEELRIAAARTPETFWTADFWQHPLVQFLGGLLGGSSSSAPSETEPRNWR